MKKRIFATLMVAVLALTLLPTTAFAHGHSGSSKGTSYALCSTTGCNTAGIHKHGNTYYAGHSLGDGHDYHQACTVQDCTKTNNHDHDGVTCFPHSNADGHSYHSSEHGGKGRHH